MKPFLLLATRADDAAAEDEYAGFCRYGGLEPAELHRVRLEAGPMPPIDLDAYSGVFLGGSPFNASEEHPSPVQRRVEADLRGLIRRIVATDHPFLGACYGVGVLGVALDGVVDDSFGEPPGAVTITLTEAGRADPLLAALPESFSAIVGHKEACSRLPSGAVLLGTGERCPIQLFRLGFHVYATQFHPELDADSLAHRLRIYADHGYCARDEAAGIVAATRRHDLGSATALLRAFVETYRR